MNNKPKLTSIRLALAVALGLAASTVSSHAQGATGTLTGVQVSANYDYTLTLNNTGGVALESLWYAWIPGFFFLPDQPSSASGTANGATSGWAASIAGNSIQFQGNSSDAIQPGNSATFTFVSIDSPATLAGNNFGHPIGDSFAYTGTVDASSGVNFIVQSVPEPSLVGLIVVGSLGLLASGWRKLRAQ
jgi:hypothetical protein